MRTEKLLDAIGDINDKFIEDAAPKKKSKNIRINWVKYGSIAACFLLFAVLIYGMSTIRMGSNKESAAADSAAPEDMIMEDVAIEEEAAVDEDAPAAEEPAEGTDETTEEYPAEEAPAEDVPAENESAGSESGEDIIDVAYGIVVNGDLYFPISFQERKDYGLVNEDATGLTPENTYKITEEDIGEAIGAVTFSTRESNVGLVLYHFAKYPEDQHIGILDNHGVYEFYVYDSPYIEE